MARNSIRFITSTDWVLGTQFNLDGTRLVTASRDKNLWVLDLSTHHPVDPINDPSDGLTCVVRHPKQDIVVTGTASGIVRIHRLTDLQKMTEQNREPNRIRDVERQAGCVNAIVFSADGECMAIASLNEVRVYTSGGDRRICICPAAGAGGMFCAGFSPDAKRLYTAGFDGKVRMYSAENGQVLNTFVPVPITSQPAH